MACKRCYAKGHNSRTCQVPDAKLEEVRAQVFRSALSSIETVSTAAVMTVIESDRKGRVICDKCGEAGHRRSSCLAMTLTSDMARAEKQAERLQMQNHIAHCGEFENKPDPVVEDIDPDILVERLIEARLPKAQSMRVIEKLATAYLTIHTDDDLEREIVLELEKLTGWFDL